MHCVDHDRFEVWHAYAMVSLMLRVHGYFAVQICARVQQHEGK
jgi:hypothetical protein